MPGAIALEELYPREDGFRCTAEGLPDDGDAPRQKLAGTERKAVQLECRSPLQAQQSHQNFSGPAQRLTERTADALAENAEGWFRADAGLTAIRSGLRMWQSWQTGNFICIIVTVKEMPRFPVSEQRFLTQ